jgi:hypothetical protein
MALGLGSAIAALWAGPVLDVFGVRGLLGAAVGLAAASSVSALAIRRRQRVVLARAAAERPFSAP